MSLKVLYEQIEIEVAESIQRGIRIEVSKKLEVFRVIRDAWTAIEDIKKAIAKYNDSCQPLRTHFPSALPFGLSTLQTSMKTNAFRSVVGLEIKPRNRGVFSQPSPSAPNTSSNQNQSVKNVTKEKWTVEIGFHLKKLLPFIRISREQWFDPPK